MTINSSHYVAEFNSHVSTNNNRHFYQKDTDKQLIEF